MADKITEDDVVAALRKSLALDVRRKKIEWANDAEETLEQEAERMQAAADFRDVQQAYIQQFDVKGNQAVTDDSINGEWHRDKFGGVWLVEDMAPGNSGHYVVPKKE